MNNDEAMAVYDKDMAQYEIDLAGYTDKVAKLTAEYSVELAVYEAQKAELTRDVGQLGTRINDLTAKEDKARNERNKFLQLGDLKKELQAIDDAPSSAISIVDCEARKLELTGKIQAINDKVAALRSELSATKKSLAAAQENNTIARTHIRFNEEAAANNTKVLLQIDALKKDIADGEKRIELLEEWVRILGPNGYRVHKMSSFLKLLNAAMLKYSKMITNGKVNCRFFVTNEGKIDFIVTDADKTLPYRLWSEGEKARVKLSCLFAVLEILEMMGAVSFNLLFLDEIFSALDDEGKDGLFAVLAHLRDKGKSIYTISHTPLVNSVVFDQVYWALKENGISILS
jgi:DNA repair exonuclease SbcCD ATPase subunit